eukprot:3828957-Prymnesium_polylepis.1
MVLPLNLTVMITGSVVGAGSTGGTKDGGTRVDGVDGGAPCGVDGGAESASLHRYPFRRARKASGAAVATCVCSAPNDDSNVPVSMGTS